MNRELADRFGPPPPAVGNLLDYALLKGLAEGLLVSSIERRANEVAIKFHPETPLSPGEIGWADPVQGGRVAAGPERHALDAPREAGPDRRKRQKRVASSGNEAINS